MFMVAWEGSAPADRAEWMQAMRSVFACTSGTYRVRFLRGTRGWRLQVECQDPGEERTGVITNGPDSVRFNLLQALRERDKPVDPDWVQDGWPSGGGPR